MIKSSLLVFVFVLSSTAFGQVSNDAPCYEILYLDFFGLVDMDAPKWPESELEGLKELISKQQKKDSSLKVNFALPIIAYQLQELHPNCLENTDLDYLSQIIDLYLVIRQQNQDLLVGSSIEEKIDFIRNDFYELVKVDENLMEMSFNLDDGPFYGIDTEEEGTPFKSFRTRFGKLSISNFEGSSVLSAIDENGAVIWRKIITGLDDRVLGEIIPAADLQKETSLATVFNFYAGERLTLYLKNDGQFMYYYHSW